MRILTLTLSLLASPAFAKFTPPETPSESIALKFSRSCAHALDAEQGQELLYRQMQGWLEIYLRDPSPNLPAEERFANLLSELYELALDRIADFPAGQRAYHRKHLEESKLGSGAVPDASDALVFLSTLTEINHDLRRAQKPDLGAAAFAGALIGIMNGTLEHDDVRVGVEDPDDLDTRYIVIEPAAHDTFVAVEDALEHLRRDGGRALGILRSAERAQSAFRPEAAFETIRHLEAARADLPSRLTELIDRLVALRRAFDLEAPEQKNVTFTRIGLILKEIAGYSKLADQMNRLGWAVWSDDLVFDAPGMVAR